MIQSVASPSDPRTGASVQVRSHRPWHAGFWSAYAVQMRPYLLFVSGITGWVGLSMTESIQPERLAAVLAASFLAYGFGQALTDCFQGDTDALSSPYRPLVRGILLEKDVLIVSLVGLLSCTAVFAVANPRSLLAGFGAVAGLLAYSSCKRVWWTGPPCNASVVVMLFIMGVLAGQSSASWGSILVRPDVLLAAVAVFFGYTHFILTGYFKDMEADRATGYRTVVVRFGRRRAALATDVVATLTGAATLAAIVLVSGEQDLGSAMARAPLAGGVLAAGIFGLLISQIRLHRVRRDDEAWRAILPGLHGFLFLMAAVALARHPSWWPGILVFQGLFATTLSLRPERSQV